MRIFSAAISLQFLEISTIIPAKLRLIAAENLSQIALADSISPSLDKQHSYNTIRADSQNFLAEYGLLAFCEFDEYSALYIALQPDTKGQYAIWSAPTIKIAASLEEFVDRLFEEPDYFLDDDFND